MPARPAVDAVRTVVLRCLPRLDGRHAAELKAAVADALGSGADRVVIDLRPVLRLDLAGIQAVVNARRLADDLGASVLVVLPRADEPARLARMVRLGDLVPQAPWVETGLSA